MATDPLSDAPEAGAEPPPPPGRWRRQDWSAAGLCIASGALLALSLPPWGFWPLAFLGIIGLDRLLADRPRWSRFRRGWLVGLALMGPTMIWLKDLTAPGFVIAVVLFAAMVGGFMALCPPGTGRRLALPGAWLLAEALRGAWPFGGVPLSVLAMGQVGGPLAPVVRLGGTLLLGGLVVAIGVGLSAAVDRSWRTALGWLVVVVVVVAAAIVAPSGADTGKHLSVSLVQGGGPQGTHAIDTDMKVVFRRHLDASATVPRNQDLTLWPEDVVDTSPYVVDDPEGEQLAALARRLHTTLIAGVVDDETDTTFHNASEVWNSRGQVIDRYEKQHRVPFGEYVPFRSLIESLDDQADLPQADAVVGKGPGTLTTPDAKLAVVISWEVFFGNRARNGVLHGGELLINPTNGSSFTDTFIQTQQIASSRLRAIETGRWVVQVAPTGFSAFVTPTGKVLERTGVSERAVRSHTVALRHGLTVYTRWGDHPFDLLGLLLVAGGWVLDRRRRPVVEPVATAAPAAPAAPADAEG